MWPIPKFYTTQRYDSRVEIYLHVFLFNLYSILCTLRLRLISHVYLSYHSPYKYFFILTTILMSSAFTYVFYVSVSYHCLCCVFIHLYIESRGLATAGR